MRNNMMPPQGGLKTDGQQVDPVSGNKVPVGSNANEVRDDIPAQLSDGEYVVPADIVRYYGVKFFEDLRNQGKGGLQDMAANGRIGGDPVPPGGPQATGFSPEETQAMQSMVGAAMGGMMTQQMPPADPYAQQANMYQQRQGYVDGGFGSREAVTTPTRYRGAFSWETPEPETGGGDTGGNTGSDQTTVTLYCPDGSINTLQLPSDQDRYDTLVATGCGLDQSILGRSDDDDGPDTPEVTDEQRNAWMEDYGYTGKGTESFEDIIKKSEEALAGENKNFIEKLLSGGAIGKFQQATTAAQVAGNIIILTENLPTDINSPEYKKQKDLLDNLIEQREKYIKENGLGLLPDEFINGDQFAKQINSTQIDWALSETAVDPNGKRIFDSPEDFAKHVEKVSSDPSKGISAVYDPTTGSVKYTYDPSYVGSLRPKIRPPETGDGTGGGTGDGTGGGTNSGPTIKPPSGESPTLGVTPEMADAPTADTGGGMTGSDTRPGDPRGEGQYGGPDNSVSSEDLLRTGIEDDLAATQAIFEGEPAAGTTGSATGPQGVSTTQETGPDQSSVTTTYTFEEPETTATYYGGSSDDDDDYSIPTVATGTQAYGGSTAAETALIQSDLSDDDFWDEFESGTSGGGSSGGGSSTTTTNTASSGRTESQIQADINAALSASGGAWTSELNDLVSERDSARSNEGGGSSNDDDGGGSAPSGGGGGCCFIMLEARYGNGTMDEVVRRYRDEYMTDRNRRGYYRMAEVLVPLMRKSKTFKWIITKTFADPLVSYGKYYYGQNKHGVIYSPLKNFWMKVFDVVGGDTKFIRENGEVV